MVSLWSIFVKNSEVKRTCLAQKKHSGCTLFKTAEQLGTFCFLLCSPWNMSFDLLELWPSSAGHLLRENTKHGQTQNRHFTRAQDATPVTGKMGLLTRNGFLKLLYTQVTWGTGLLKCTFWFIWCGVGPEILHFTGKFPVEADAAGLRTTLCKQRV